MEEKDYLRLWNISDPTDQAAFGSYDEFKKHIDKIHKEKPPEQGIEETNDSD
jgi:hypothetical protein